MALTLAATLYLYEYVLLGASWNETHSGDSSCLKSVPGGSAGVRSVPGVGLAILMLISISRN
jgi:hypothetical protein